MKTIYSICVVVIFSLFFLNDIKGQAPANNLCADAIEITPASEFFCSSNSLSQTTQGATNTMELNPGCFEDDLDGGDVWNFFFASETSHVIQYSSFDLFGSLGFPVSALYSGDCGSLALIGCDAGFQVRFDGLSPGTKYYLRTWLKSSNIGPSNFAEFDICVGTTTGCPEQEVIYVTEGGSGTGESWASSLGSLQDALAISCACPEVSQIWVGEGNYYPDEGQMEDDNERNESFKLCSGVSVFGGFMGNETQLNDRDPDLNPTILSGDINQSGDSIGNSYTIVMNMNVNNTSSLDGFVITGANSDGGAPNVPTFVAGGVLNYFSSLTIANCLLEENFGGNAAGGIYLLESSPNITNCTIRNNIVLNSGAGIFAFNSSPIIENSVVENNTANSFEGGGLSIINSNSTVVISNTQVINNTAGEFGGGVIIVNSSVDMEGCIVDDNTSGSRGGGIFVDENSIVNIFSSEIKGNTATALYGGGIYIDGASGNDIGLTTVNISDSEISGNTAGQFGGGLISFGAISVIENCDFSMNTSEEQGGAMWIWQPSSLSIVNSNFENNSTGLDGGAIYYSQEFFGNPIEISGSVFTGNEAFSLQFPNGPPSITNGGAIYINEVSEISIDDSEFSLNEATRGGAIFTGSDKTTTITNSVFTENSATGGGAIFCSGFLEPVFDLVISGCEFNSNTGQLGFAGAIHSQVDGIRILSSTFTGNSSDEGAGAVFRVSSVHDSHFENNSSLEQGAVRSVDSIIGCTFINNTSSSGIGSGGAVNFLASNDGYVEGSLFLGNSAGLDGGAVHWAKTIKNSTFLGNSAGNLGGAITNSGSVKIENSIFGDNSAGNNGGGVYIGGTDTEVKNCLFWGNIAGNNGGGAYVGLGSNKKIINSTFSENDAMTGGGAIYLTNDADIINCIIWNNFIDGNPDVSGASFQQFGSGTTTFTHNLIANSGGSMAWDANFGIDNGGNLDSDPLFQNPGNEDFSLQEISPCINAGTPDTTGLNLPGLDLAGNERIQGDTIDMGAFEYTPPPPFECPADEILYVVEGASGEGSSWSDALGSLQDALSIACLCVEVSQIWVAEGTYYPDEGLNVSPGDRDATFQLCNGVELYGGFNGTETELNQRDWEANETTLSGDINQSGSLSGNSFTVVTGSNTDSTAILDGFFIVLGNADGTGAFPNPNRRGAGMFIMDGSLLVNNCSFIDNAAVWGGGMYILNSNLHGNNLVFQNNSVTSQGGGIFSDGSDLELADFLFENNSAPNSGGGIYFNNGEMVLTNGAFIDNSTLLTGSSGGGGLFVNNSAGDIVLDDIEFIGNSSRFGGGVFAINSQSSHLTDCIFQSNSAAVSGGGLNFSNSQNIIIVNGLFENNIAATVLNGQGGGALFTNSEFSITGSQFIDNSATWGGGFDAFNVSSAIVTNCTFESNSAAFGGGLRFRNSQNAVVENCLFEDNIAEFRSNVIDPGIGGGIFVVLDSDVEVINSVFVDNTALFAGGGLTFSGNSDGKVNNCLVYNNQSDSLAGGFGLLQSTATILNSTIVNNLAAVAGGLGLASTSGATDVEVINSIIFGNIASDEFDNVGSEGGDISFEFSIVEGSGGSGDWDSDFGVDLGGNMDIDPQFADPASGNFQLTECSPGLDAGTPDTTGLGLPAMDLEGNPRFFDALGDGVARVDIGAFEFHAQGTLLEVECISSLVVQLNEQGEAFLNTIEFEVSELLVIQESCLGGVGFVEGTTEFDCGEAGELVPVILTAFDSISLRQASCILTVEVLDTIPPMVAFCPSSVDTTITEEGVTEVFFSLPLAEFADACGIESIENNINAGGANASDSYGPGTTEVVITATDSSGNSSQCVFLVTVTVPFTISCPQDAVLTTDMGVCSGVVSLDEATAFSPFQPVTITNDFNNGGPDASDSYPQGITVVTFTATDDNGDMVSCTTTVTVNDTEPPSISCPADVAVVIPDGTGPADVTLSLATASDNCTTDPEISNDHNSGGADASGIYAVGTTVVTFEAEDEIGNTNSCTTAVTVEEADALTINCPSNATVETDPGECTAEVTLALATAFSGFPPVTITNDFNNGGPDASDSYSQGITVVTFTATDDNGDMVSCTTTVIVNDTEPPSISCPADVTVVIPEGTGPADVTLSLATASDNCTSDPEISNDQNSGGANASGMYPVGTTVVTFEAEDETGNTNSCTTAVTVEEADALTINCPSNATVNTDPGECTAEVTLALATAFSGFPPVTIENDFNDGGADASGIYDEGVTTIVFTASDGNGDMVSCTTVVTVNDMEAPTLNCPSMVFANTAASSCNAFVSLVVTASDNCGIEEAGNSFNSGGLNASGTYGLGDTEVIFTVSDAGGLSSSCTVVVSVTDNVAPQITCPADVSVMVDPGENSKFIGNLVATASDNCTTDPEISNNQNSEGDDASGDYPVGVTMVIFTAEDEAGNVSNCTTVVEVIDVLPLILSCPDDVEISVDEGQCGRNLTLIAELEGGIEPVVVTNTKTSNGLDASAFYELGTEVVAFTATADDGETAICSVTVTIVDDEAPELVCNNLTIELAAAPVSIEVEDIVPSAEDNCGIESIELSQSEFGCDDLGTHIVQVTATDEAGNEANCTAIVTVEDNTPPTAVCSEIDMVFTTVLETATPDINDLDGGSSDACGVVNLSADIPDLSCADAGTVEIELIVEDANGNTSVCTAVVNVVCAALQFEISGQIYHEDGSMVGGVKVDLLGFENASFETESDGEYEFTVFGGTNAIIIPLKDTLPVENVTTLDIIMIQRHILGKELLDSPYKIIASDASGDGVTSTFDLVLFQTLIVGLIEELPVPSWVFVKSSYEFEDPTNPLAESFPTVRAFQAVMTDYEDQDFIGVKLGYVKYSINGDSRVERGNPVEILLVQDGPDVLIKTTEAIDLSGLSMSLERGASDHVSQGLLSEQGLSNWHMDEAGVLRYIWTTGGILNAGKGEVIFRMKNVQASDIMLSESDRLPSEVVTGDKVIRPIQFVEWEQPGYGLSLEVYPNPFHQLTRIYVDGLGEETGLLEIYDLSGSLLIQRDVENGEVISLNQLLGNLPAGVLIVRLSSSDEVKLKRVVGFK